MSRVKSLSNPELATERSSPSVSEPHFRERIQTSFTEEGYRGGTYGSIQEKRGSCCVAGEHFMTSNSREFFNGSLSMDSVVHVDISDINGEGDVSYVPLSLRKCKRTIIAPYSCLLSFIGWRPWFQESLSRRSSFWKYFNCIYPAVIMGLIITHYFFQVLNCQGKFNIHKDVQPSPTPPIPQVVNMRGNCSWGIVTFVCHAQYVVDSIDLEMNRQVNDFCQHIIPTYVIPSFVHFLAFAYGFYHFRLVECEQLFSLMERVFLQCHTTPSLQNALIRNSRLFFIASLIWLLFQVGLEILYCISFPQKRLEIWGIQYKNVLLGIKMLSLILVQGVNVAVSINYCIQCETLILYIKGICWRLHEKSIEIKSAMHEILGVREYISLLNGNVAKMMAFGILNFAELTILGTALLFLNRNSNEKIISYRVIFPMLWFIALMVPLIQAARLTRIGSKLRQISFETRVFGYQTCSMTELDSFVLFVNGATLRSKLFGMTIRSSTVILTVGLSVFVLLTLMVVDILTVSGYTLLF